MTPAPITTADMLKFCRDELKHLNNLHYQFTNDPVAIAHNEHWTAIFEAILARLEQQEPPSAVVSVGGSS